MTVGLQSIRWSFITNAQAEIDLADGDYWADSELARKYRDETVRFVRTRLGLDGTEPAFTTGIAVIDSFDVIGEALRKSCSIGKFSTKACPELLSSFLTVGHQSSEMCLCLNYFSS